MRARCFVDRGRSISGRSEISSPALEREAREDSSANLPLAPGHLCHLSAHKLAQFNQARQCGTTGRGRCHCRSSLFPSHSRIRFDPRPDGDGQEDNTGHSHLRDSWKEANRAPASDKRILFPESRSVRLTSPRYPSGNEH